MKDARIEMDTDCYASKNLADYISNIELLVADLEGKQQSFRESFLDEVIDDYERRTGETSHLRLRAFPV